MFLLDLLIPVNDLSVSMHVCVCDLWTPCMQNMNKGRVFDTA